MLPSPRRAAALGSGFQRRLRRAVPAPVRRADLAAFRSVARLEVPVVGPMLPRLSRLANSSGLWITLAAGLATSGGRTGRRAAVRGLLSVAVTSAVTNIPGKGLTGRARPDRQLVPEVRRLARVPSSTSFPSGHAASALAFATAVSMERKDLRVPLFALASAVAFSRVYIGVHYPGDVLAGAALGAGVARTSARVWPVLSTTPADSEVVAADPSRFVAADGAGLVVVANVGAGNALLPAPAAQLRAALPGVEVQTVEAGEELPAALQRAAAGARMLGVAGGDGSASSAAEAAASARVPLAVIPTGTLNHLGSDLGVGNVAEAIEAVRSGRVLRMDLGVLDGRTFVNAVAVGTYPSLVRLRDGLAPYLGKWPAALVALARILATHPPIELRIDGRARRVWHLFVGNGRFVAEGIAPSRRTRLDEACLDVRLVSGEVPWARARVLLALLTGRLGRCVSVERWVTERVDLEFAGPELEIAADGELRTVPGTFSVRTLPGGLLVLASAPGEQR